MYLQTVKDLETALLISLPPFLSHTPSAFLLRLHNRSVAGIAFRARTFGYILGSWVFLLVFFLLVFVLFGFAIHGKEEKENLTNEWKSMVLLTRMFIQRQMEVQTALSKEENSGTEDEIKALYHLHSSAETWDKEVVRGRRAINISLQYLLPALSTDAVATGEPYPSRRLGRGHWGLCLLSDPGCLLHWLLLPGCRERGAHSSSPVSCLQHGGERLPQRG
ncbi:hypothetical protein Nmel_003216 [Mimus melanotis]